MTSKWQGGTAEMTRHADGTVTVERADRIIGVSWDLLDAPDLQPWVLPNGDKSVLVLDTAGTYRYRHIGTDPLFRREVYVRIEDE